MHHFVDNVVVAMQVNFRWNEALLRRILVAGQINEPAIRQNIGIVIFGMALINGVVFLQRATIVVLNNQGSGHALSPC
jgi:hypothetical protein